MMRLLRDASEYRTRVVIERLKSSATVNAAGHIDETDSDNWEEYITRWANITYGKGSERLVGDQQNATQLADVELRSDSGTRAITTAMRMRLSGSGEVFNIAEPPVDIDGRRVSVRFQVARLVR